MTAVSTYIARGNVILRSDRAPATIKREIEAALPKAFRLDSELIAVLVLTHEQVRAVVGRKPRGFGEQPDTYHSDAIFLIGVDADSAMEVFDPRRRQERPLGRRRGLGRLGKYEPRRTRGIDSSRVPSRVSQRRSR